MSWKPSKNHISNYPLKAVKIQCQSTSFRRNTFLSYKFQQLRPVLVIFLPAIQPLSDRNVAGSRHFSVARHAVSIDDLIAHGVHDEAGNGFGADLRLHVLPDGFDGAGGKKDFFGDLFGGFVLCQEF